MVDAPSRDCIGSTPKCIPIYDINHAGVEEKFANSIIHSGQFIDSMINNKKNCDIFQKWSGQSDFQFRFIPLGENLAFSTVSSKSLIEVTLSGRQVNQIF